MMRTGLQILGVHSSEAVMIGDRMDTDIIAGIETGLDTALVLIWGIHKRDCERISVSPETYFKWRRGYC